MVIESKQGQNDDILALKQDFTNQSACYDVCDEVSDHLKVYYVHQHISPKNISLVILALCSFFMCSCVEHL